jgi:hypothetical protein
MMRNLNVCRASAWLFSSGELANSAAVVGENQPQEAS